MKSTLAGALWLQWVIVLAGAFVPARMIRGRVAGEHPVCARRGYDRRARDP
jgi:hypothetical protein